MNIFHKTVKRNLPQITFVRNYVSALYMTGDQAKTSYAVLTPYMDFESTLKQGDLIGNIKRRQLAIDYNGILEKYEYFVEVQRKKSAMDERRQSIAIELKQIAKESNTKADYVNKLKEEGRIIRDELKALKENFYPIEDEFIHAFLNLPNRLHPKCPPTDEPILLYRNGLVDPTTKSESHLNRTDLIDYRDSFTYYLLKEAAEFDLQFTYNAVEYFIEKGYTQMANPDFSRGIVTEANTTEQFYHGVDEHDGEIRINNLNLSGGGSFESFFGYIAKLSVYPSVLPIKFIASGRQYRKSDITSESGLLSAIQSNVVQSFVATQTETEADAQMEEILNLAVDLYSKLDAKFQIIYKPAKELLPSECLCAAIEMYSPHLGKYIEVGRISHFSDYVSKRILFNTRDKKDYKFLNVVGGTVANTSRILACLVENQIDLKKLVSAKGKVDNIAEFKKLFD